ncbi:MAG: GNAT family N-acetyltransferase [Caldilineaceae bacterium]|nr:GNAT family N-acetyltransferase [Caldilineaceae bacterium]
MVIRLLQPGDEAALEAFLRPRWAASMFLLSNSRAAGLVNNDERGQGRYAAAFEDGKITGVVAHYWNGNLIPQCPGDELDALWRLAAGDRPVHGVLGPGEQAFSIIEALKPAPDRFMIKSRDKLYALELNDLRVPEPLATGAVQARRARPDDLGQLAAWRVAYNTELLETDDTPDLRRECAAGVKRQQEAGSLWVAVKDGGLLSMTGFNAQIQEAVQIGGVYTPPSARGRGYARMAVAQSLLDARNEGVSAAILFTGEINLPAQRAYESLGFRQVGDYAIILLRA